MARILLASQWGGGAGHARKLLALADSLRSVGHEPVLALPDLISARHVERRRGHSIVQGPVWRGRILKRQPTRGFADIMAQQGFADSSVLFPLVDAWDSLLDHLSPEVVIADYAPMLCLAAHGKLPLMAIGVPFCLPPSTMNSFPALNSEAKAAFPEKQLLHNANAWLQHNDRPTLDALPAIHPDQYSLCFGLPQLDPYQHFARARPVQPYRRITEAPLGAAPAGPRCTVFAYLSARHKPAMQLLLALAEQGVLVEVSLRDFSRPVARRLVAAGVLVHEGLANLHDALSRNSLYIHHGSEGAAADGLMFGRPQLCLPIDLEKQLISQSLRELGVARVIQGKQLPDDAVDQTLATVSDKTLHQQAHGLSEWLCREQSCRGLESVVEAVQVVVDVKH